jgi:hypothetical protein
MTTKVTVTCSESSHWNLVVTTEDKVWDSEAKKLSDDWVAVAYPPVVVLKPLESHETYLTSTRRIVVSEGDPVA